MGKINVRSRTWQKLDIFFRFATELSELSTCKRAACGAIILSPAFSCVRAIGYNGPAAGLNNESCSGEEGHCGCAHAEANALVKLDLPERDLIMLSTTQPCPMCASLIVNCKKIKAVIFGKEYRLEGSANILACGTVESHHIGEITDATLNRLFRLS